MYLNPVSLFSLDVAVKEGLLTARAMARAHRVVLAIAEQFALVKKRKIPATVAEKSPTPSPPGDSRRLRVRLRTKPSRHHLVLTSLPSPQEKRRPSFSYEGSKVTTLVLKFAESARVKPHQRRHAGSG